MKFTFLCKNSGFSSKSRVANFRFCDSTSRLNFCLGLSKQKWNKAVKRRFVSRFFVSGTDFRMLSSYRREAAASERAAAGMLWTSVHAWMFSNVFQLKHQSSWLATRKACRIQFSRANSWLYWLHSPLAVCSPLERTPAMSRSLRYTK